jgi:hypothetical protein
MSAGTAHALVYEDEEYTHRIVVVAEVDSLPDEGPAASAIRSIAQDNERIYKVVEREARSGHFVTRTIRKHGPTGVIRPRRGRCARSSARGTWRCPSRTMPSRHAR